MGNGIIRRALRGNARIGLERAATIRLRREAGELRLEFFARRQVNDAQGALEQPADELHLLVGRTRSYRPDARFQPGRRRMSDIRAQSTALPRPLADPAPCRRAATDSVKTGAGYR